MKYLGILDYAACIEEMEKSHFIPAFYKPNTEININAASNKLAESLAIGRPLLLNDEMRIMEISQEARQLFPLNMRTHKDCQKKYWNYFKIRVNI